AKNSRKSTLVKVLLIILGALVATKGVADNFMVDITKYIHPMVVALVYTLIGVAIAIAAGIDSFFEFSKKASALALLTSDARSRSRHYMSEVDAVASTENQEASRRIVEEMNKDLESIYRKAAELGIDLALDNPVDYSLTKTGTTGAANLTAQGFNRKA